MQISYAIFIRAYCEVLGRDYWSVHSFYATKHETFTPTAKLVLGGQTVTVMEVVHPLGKIPNL